MLEPQFIAVILVIAVATAYVVRRTIRTWSGAKKSGCGGGCGCSRVIDQTDTKSETLIPTDQLRVRVRQ